MKLVFTLRDKHEVSVDVLNDTESITRAREAINAYHASRFLRRAPATFGLTSSNREIVISLDKVIMVRLEK